MHQELSNTPSPVFMLLCWWELLCSQTSRRGLELSEWEHYWFLKALSGKKKERKKDLLKVEVNLFLGKTGLQETWYFQQVKAQFLSYMAPSQAVLVVKNLPGEGDA